MVGNRRGVHLITAVERLVRLSGEFQRIALSATVRPLEKVAEFIGGLQVTGAGPEPRYSPRAVATVRSTDAKRYEIQDSADGNARKVSADTGADAADGEAALALPARYREAANVAKPIMRSDLRW